MTQWYTLRDIAPGAVKLRPGQMTQITNFTFQFENVSYLGKVKHDSTAMFCPQCDKVCHKLAKSRRGLVCDRCLKRQSKPYSEGED